jgi:hypothetical protein
MRHEIVMILSATAVVFVVTSSVQSAAVARDRLTGPMPLHAPVGHAQPTPGGFLSNETPNPNEQQRLSDYDAQQHLLDQKLDKSLNICRC